MHDKQTPKDVCGEARSLQASYKYMKAIQLYKPAGRFVGCLLTES